MGLDMYLFSLPKLEGMDFEEVLLANGQLRKHMKEQNEIYEKLKTHIKNIQEFDYVRTSLMEQVAYWRKANQIHNWFVETTHDGIDEPCFITEVTKENLEDLYHLCLKVLERDTHPIDLLPTKPGCFFGSTGYDHFYYREIEETKSILAYLLQHFNFETHYLLYQCSW